MANYTIEVTTEDGGNFTFPCESDQYIIDAAEEAGVELNYSCRAGACSTCVSKLVSGTVDQSDQSYLDDDQQSVTKEINGYKIKPYGNLSFVILCGADLRGADLTGAELEGAELTGADFRKADLRNVDFTNCKGIKSAKGISKEFLRAAHKVGYLIYNEDN